MSDVIGGGGDRRPVPRWVWALTAAIAAVAIIVAGVTRSGAHRKATREPEASTTPSTSPAPTKPDGSATLSAAPTLVGPTSPGPGWPSASGGCGSMAYLPQRTLASQHGKVSGTVLVGGTGLVKVSLDGPSASATPVTGASAPPGALFDAIAAGPHAAFAQIGPCGGGTGVTGAFYRIARGVAQNVASPAAGDQFLVGGAHHAWAVRYPEEITPSSGVPFNSGVVLTPLDGGPAITLEANSYLVEDTAAGLVVGVQDAANPNAPPHIELVNATTGHVIRTIIGSYPVAAQGHEIIVQSGGCGVETSPITCTLEQFDLTTGKLLRGYPMPIGRSPISDGVFSRDGRLLAFHLMRADQDPRFSTGHPAPPSDLAVLHLDTGRLAIVPNLEFAPKSFANLAFDATGTSLLATIFEGDHGELLIWQEGMTAPALVTSLPGPIDAPPPLLLEPPSARQSTP